MKKILWILGIGLLALIIALAIGVDLYIGPIIKMGMQDIGPQIIQVPIQVDTVDVNLLAGNAQFKGLKVGNPKGYKTRQAISVGTVVGSVDPFSVFSGKIIVHSVKVESPEITFEGGLNGSNLSKIMANVNAQAQNSAFAPSNNSSNTNNAVNNKPAPKIEVGDFLITNAKVHVSLTGLFGKEMTLPLPDIHLTDLGKGSNGLTPAQLTSTVLEALIKDTITVVATSAAKLGQDVQNLGKGTGVTANEALNKITSSISGLLGK